MAQYEHLPIYKKAYDLTLYFEKIVRNFSRYDKYTIGADLRQLSREVLRLIRPRSAFIKILVEGIVPKLSDSVLRSKLISNLQTPLGVKCL